MKQKTYGARSGAPFRKSDAQKIGEFIDSIDDKTKTSRKILDEIKKNKDHIIYGYIEWDDSIAGEKYRLQQVRGIVSHISIEVKQVGGKLPIKAFHSITFVGKKDPIYVNLNKTFSDKYCRNQIINRAKSELSNWTERYHQYNELSDIIDKISEFLGED